MPCRLPWISAAKGDRLPAAEAHWGVTGDTKDALPGLIELLKTKDLRPGSGYVAASTHRHRVIGILGRIGPAAKEAVPLIVQLVREEDAENARRSVWSWPHVHDEEDREEDQYTVVRRAGVAALKQLDPEAVKQVAQP